MTETMKDLMDTLTPIQQTIFGVRLFHNGPNPDRCDACALPQPCPSNRLADEVERLQGCAQDTALLDWIQTIAGMSDGCYRDVRKAIQIAKTHCETP